MAHYVKICVFQFNNIFLPENINHSEEEGCVEYTVVLPGSWKLLTVPTLPNCIRKQITNTCTNWVFYASGGRNFLIHIFTVS